MIKHLNISIQKEANNNMKAWLWCESLYVSICSLFQAAKREHYLLYYMKHFDSVQWRWLPLHKNNVLWQSSTLRNIFFSNRPYSHILPNFGKGTIIKCSVIQKHYL
jgi:hypothetical protein